MFLYKKNGMNWTVPEVDVGVTTDGKYAKRCQDVILSRTKGVLNIDNAPGNIDLAGVWVYKLGDRPPKAEQACVDWQNRNEGQVKLLRDTRFKQLPKCPCMNSMYYPMQAFGIWAPLRGLRPNLTCYRLTKTASLNYYPHGKECC
ncbi:uncharacterized protein, partial [Littorina saxatilis]|uniref:uncharacterized protein n=1 Tax=Littorina saxatilis TaxID=31220 RepID=UPI0038B57270